MSDMSSHVGIAHIKLAGVAHSNVFLSLSLPAIIVSYVVVFCLSALQLVIFK